MYSLVVPSPSPTGAEGTPLYWSLASMWAGVKRHCCWVQFTTVKDKTPTPMEEGLVPSHLADPGGAPSEGRRPAVVCTLPQSAQNTRPTPRHTLRACAMRSGRYWT
ncbi:MAG: hypothetical protein WDW38_005195 [Sanguina aurantia]